jgi:hypothetical protein
MTKFESLDDPGFVAVAGELRRWIKQLARATAVNNPAVDMRGPNNGSESRGYTITQGGSSYHGPTTVTGGSLFQGNFIGGNI